MIYTKGRQMKIFISGPITGTYDYMQRFEAAEAWLKDRGYMVVNPARVLAAIPFELPWDKCMAITLTLLGECDAIYILDGWVNSDGASVEYCYARKQGLHIFHEVSEDEQKEEEEG